MCTLLVLKLYLDYINMKVNPLLTGCEVFPISLHGIREPFLYMVLESPSSFPVPNSLKLKHRNIIIETADGYILGSGTDF